MIRSDQDIERALERLEARTLEEPGLPTERAAALHEFFDGGRATDELAERRFREWFLLERPTELSQTPPVQALGHAVVAEGVLEAHELAALAGSFCGVFEITSVVEGEGVWVRDLLSGGEHPLTDPEGSLALAPEDVLIGRLFVCSATANRLSRATAVFRHGDVRAAIEHDVERAHARRRGVLRLSQRDLEAMFWSPKSSATVPGSVERARAWLEQAGFDAEWIDTLFAELAALPPGENQWTVGTHDALGDVLDELAFESEVDLETARRLLLPAWLELAERSRPVVAHEPSAPTEERDVRSALAAFDRGRAEGKDLERLFAELERDLGLDPTDDDAADDAPDFPGAVAAVVEEFLWETERELGPDAARECASIRGLGEFGRDLGVIENLGAREIVAYASVWLVEHGGLAGSDEARGALAALRAFVAWAADRQGLEFDAALGERLDALERSLPRIVEANRHLSKSADCGGELYELKAIDGDGGGCRVDAQGREARIAIARECAAHLVVGDRLRVVTNPDGRTEIVGAYPRECAFALEGR
jgi:hypothetical protein